MTTSTTPKTFGVTVQNEASAVGWQFVHNAHWKVQEFPEDEEKSSGVYVLPKGRTSIPLDVSGLPLSFVVKLANDVEATEYPIENLADDDDVPEPTNEVKLTALALLFDVARFLLKNDVEWATPRISVLHDGGMSLGWTTPQSRFVVYLPPTAEGDYASVVRRPGEQSQHKILHPDNVRYYVRATLVNG